MQLSAGCFLVPVTFIGPFGEMVMNMAVFTDPEVGATLVDASMPNYADGVLAALALDGFMPGDVNRIIVTHHDIDHIGSLASLAAKTGAEIFAHRIEVPYIEGRVRMVKYPPDDVLASDPARKAMFESIGFARVGHALEDGQVLAGGIRVIATPGHTPGHISLFHEPSRVIVSGDALTSDGGVLAGPTPRATPDMARAIESVRKLTELPDIAAIITYHGGLVDNEPRAQLLRVAEELEAGIA